jgi:UDP-galactopyranose mutase
MEMPNYDYLIVGAGLFGSVFAHEMTKKNKKCLVIDKRSHIGGNIYTEEMNGINVHMYGPHIFHTNDKKIWDYVNSFVPFNRFTNSPLAKYNDEMYNLPFNMNTFYQLWSVTSPEEARAKIDSQLVACDNPKNLEEYALATVGTDIYEKLIKGYTEKQWGRSCNELPVSIIKRLPIRLTFDNNYYNDSYQGVPIGGYTLLIDKLLQGVEVQLNTDYFTNKQDLENLAKTIVYTGKIDQFYSYQYGRLEYRSVTFEHEVLNQKNYQGNALVNYTDRSVPYTRIIEHKHFENGNQATTVISKEYPKESESNDLPHYPIGDPKNKETYAKYKKRADCESNVVFGGRLAEYKYYDMHQVIGAALNIVSKI